MNLSEIIEKIQNKPRPLRVFILWVSVVICMTIVFSLWAFSLKTDQVPKQVASQEQKQEEKSFEDLKKEIPTLWQSLKAGFGSLIESVTDDSGQKIEEEQSKKQTESSFDQIPPEYLPYNY